MQEQATELDKFISNYKKEIEQTDDILVIEVRYKEIAKPDECIAYKCGRNAKD